MATKSSIWSPTRIIEIEIGSGGAYFPTFGHMIDADLAPGHLVATLGFFAPGDAGGATYEILTKAELDAQELPVDEVSVHYLSKHPDYAVRILKPSGGMYHKNMFGNDIVKAAKYIERGHGEHPMGTLIIKDGVTWITQTLDLTYVNIVADATGQINVDPRNFNGKWAVTIGQDTGNWQTGRCTYHQLHGQLVVNSNTRTVQQHGVYRKGGWINHGHLRARNFNGMGIHDDSIHDSTIQRALAELCGNEVDYAVTMRSQGDTNNATNYVSVQSERAYHRSLYMNVLRQVINNVHAERTYVLTDNDGTTGAPSGQAYQNFYINATNTTINQIILDSQVGTTTPDGRPFLQVPIAGRIDLNDSTLNNINCSGYVSNRAGRYWNINGSIIREFHSVAPAQRGTISNSRMLVARAEQYITYDDCSIGTFRVPFNCRNITMNQGSIDEPLEFEMIPMGNIKFNGVDIPSVGETRGNATGFKRTTFEDCTIGTFTSFWNATPLVKGGRINECNLHSQSRAEFIDVEFGTFGHQGNTAYITRNCTAETVLSWSWPRNYNYPAGTLTERIGYNEHGKIYQNVDGVLNWLPLHEVPVAPTP